MECSTNLEVSQISGGVASAVGLERLLEKGASGSTVTEAVRHFLNSKMIEQQIRQSPTTE